MQLGLLGKITTWLKTKELSTRSVSMQCRVHGGRCSAAASRSKVSDNDLLDWHIEATETASDSNKDELIVAHMASWKTRLVISAGYG